MIDALVVDDEPGVQEFVQLTLQRANMICRTAATGEEMKLKQRFLVASALLTAGCNSGGIVEVGPNQYMLGGIGSFMDISASAVKVGFYQQAAKFCADKGLVMQTTGSTGQDTAPGQFASAEIQFSCVKGNAK